MLTRRRFLGYSAALAAVSGCRPSWQAVDALAEPANAEAFSHPELAERIANLALKKYLLGYPVNMNTPPAEFFAWRKQLLDAGIGTFAHNNVGNPFKPSSIRYNTHDFEREVIEHFGRLFGFPENDTWGFLSHSGTDSNMHGMYMGRTILKSRTGRLPKAYFTKEAHYSVQILRDLLGLETVFVKTLPDGGIDADDLAEQLAKNRDTPALVVATIGTTFKGAIDKIDRIQTALQGHEAFLHLDAALFGGYLPYTDHAGEILFRNVGDSNKPRYDSIAVSCHKFFGFASPAGLFVTTQSRFDEFNEEFGRIHNPEYIHQVPGTITCSRDGVKPAEFFFHTTPQAVSRQHEDARAILANATYLLDQLQNRFADLQPTRANDLSNTVYFKKPSQRIVDKYSLATMQLTTNGQTATYAHVVVMPHANREVLNEFLTDLESEARVVRSNG
ncbi:MAG: hypothetical protein Kow0065_22570 [Methylomicrobium sp.]